MNEKQKKVELIQTYLQLLPSYRNIDERGIKAYLALLDEVPAERLERAFIELSKKEKKFPVPAELLEYAEYVMTDEEKEARSAEIKAKQVAWLAAHFERDFGEPYKP